MSEGNNAEKLKNIFNDLEYAVFGVLLPLKKETNLNTDILGLEDMPELETGQEAAKRQQKGQELKIMTPSQSVTRLPILLAQLKQETIQKN